MSDTLLDELCRSYLGEKIKRQNILNQNGANLTYLHAQDVAEKLRLAEEVKRNITPYPSTTVVLNEQPPAEPASQPPQQQPTPSLARRLWPVAAAAALGAGGTGLAAWLNRPVDEPPVIEQPAEKIDPQVGIKVR